MASLMEDPEAVGKTSEEKLKKTLERKRRSRKIRF